MGGQKPNSEKWKQKNINLSFFLSQDINWWTGVVWIIVMFLSAAWTLVLTAPIHFHWWAMAFLQI